MRTIKIYLEISELNPVEDMTRMNRPSPLQALFEFNQGTPGANRLYFETFQEKFQKRTTFITLLVTSFRLWNNLCFVLSSRNETTVVPNIDAFVSNIGSAW